MPTKTFCLSKGKKFVRMMAMLAYTFFVRFQLALAGRQFLDFCFSSPVFDGRNGVPLSCPKCVLFLLLMDEIQYTFFLMLLVDMQTFIPIALTEKKITCKCMYIFVFCRVLCVFVGDMQIIPNTEDG